MSNLPNVPHLGNIAISHDEENRPVDLWGTFEPPRLPINLLPRVIENFAMTLARHMGADPAGLAMAAITVCAAAIPDQISLRMKQHDAGWQERARIWTALIGLPSTKKSPIISAAVLPIARMDGDLVRQWQAKHAAWSALDKAERNAIPEPQQCRHRVEDTTVEALQDVLKGSPQGVLCIRDELSGWFGSMERYAGGGKASASDRAIWLQAFNGGEYALNRVGRGTTLIPNLSVSLLGGIQPEAIRQIAAGITDDGLLQRLFPIVLRPATAGEDAPMPPAQMFYDYTVSRLTQLRPPLTGTLRFDPEAQALRGRLEQRHTALMAMETVSPKLASHIGKLDGLFGRLCLVWHCVEHAHSPILPTEIGGDTACLVADFMERFLLPHAVTFYAGTLGLSDHHERMQAVAAHIVAKGLHTITVRDVQRGTRAMRGITNADVRPLLEQLVALNWLSEASGPRASSDPTFIVNPTVHALYAERAEVERIRRAAARAALAQIQGR